MSEAKIQEITRYSGNISRVHTPKIYLYIFSLTVVLPINLLNAMQRSVPINATRVGGITEVLDNGKQGLLVSPGNEHELAEAIITFHDSPEERNKLCTAVKE